MTEDELPTPEPAQFTGQPETASATTAERLDEMFPAQEDGERFDEDTLAYAEKKSAELEAQITAKRAAKEQEEEDRAYKELGDYMTANPAVSEEDATRVVEGGRKPASEAIMNTVSGVANNVVDPSVEFALTLPKEIVKGLMDAPHEFKRGRDDLLEELYRLGVPKITEIIPPTLWQNTPGMVPYIIADTLLSKFTETFQEDIPEEGKSAIRQLTTFVANFSSFRGLSAASGLKSGILKATGKYARTGGAVDSTLNSSAAVFFGAAEDANLLNFFHTMGVLPEWMEGLTSTEENTGFQNRMNNLLVDAGMSALFAEPLTAYVMSVRANRRGVQSVAEAMADMGDETLKRQLDFDHKEAQVFWDEYMEHLGEPDPKGARITPPAHGTGLPKIEDPVGLTGEEAAASIAGRAKTASTIVDMLTGHINYNRVDSPESVHRTMSDLADAFASETDEAIGPVQRLADIETPALRDSFDMVMGRRSMNSNAPIWTIPQVKGARALHVFTTHRLLELAESAGMAPTRAKEAAVLRLINVQREVQRQVAAVGAQYSRQLGSLRKAVSDGDGAVSLINDVDRILAEAAEGQASLGHVIASLNAASREGRVDAATNILGNLDSLKGLRAAGFKTGEAIRTIYYFSMLSRISTAIRNTVGNVAHMAMRIVEMKAANLSGNMLGHPEVKDGETLQYIYGALGGFSDGLRLPQLKKLWKDVALGNVDEFGPALKEAADGGAIKSFAENASGYGIGKIGKSAVGGFSSEVWGYDPTKNFGRAMRVLDAALSVPGRSLVATDELFKSGFYRAESRALAFNQAVREAEAGLLPGVGKNIPFADPVGDRAAYLAANPSEATKLAAQKHAQSGTFTQQLPKDGDIAGAIHGIRKIRVIGKLVIPFEQTPYNVNWEVLRRTPLGAVMPSFLSDITSTNARLVDQAWSKFLVGNMTLLGIYDFFTDSDKEVRITGDTMEYDELQQAKRMNLDNMQIQWTTRPGGFETGHFVTLPYRGFEPIAGPFGIVANLLALQANQEQNDREIDRWDLYLGLGGAVATQFASGSMVSPLIDFMSIAEHPQSRTAKWVEHSLETLVTPGATSQFVGLLDPIYRETFTAFDRVKSKTPGLSSSLPPSYDALGRINQRAPGIYGVAGTAMPRVYSGEAPEPIDLWMTKNNENLTKPDKVDAQFREGVTIYWDDFPHAYAEYVRLAGDGLKYTGREQIIARRIKTHVIAGPPTGWDPAGLGFREEVNALIENRHPSRRMQNRFNEMGGGEDGEQVAFIRQAQSFYRRAAREVLAADPRFADLRAELDEKLFDAQVQETDRKKLRKLQLGFGN